MISGMVIRISTHITRFIGWKMVSLVGAVYSTSRMVVVLASCRGMEPDRPACQITKPEYAAAISSG